jgi:endonuclease YncB( thermonuclease family)
MPFVMIKGTFQIKGYSPDGDSIRFRAHNPENWKKLAGLPVNIRGNSHVQLRFQGIDALETHYKDFHQPRKLGFAARDFMLEKLGFNRVVQMAPNKPVLQALDKVEGYIISRTTEGNQRPLSYAFAGQPEEADGTSVFLDKNRLKASLNYQLLKAGLAYPNYYKGIFNDLRQAMTEAVNQARLEGLGIWFHDKTNLGFKVEGLKSISRDYVIMPKLFRYLVDYLESGGKVSQFKRYLEKRPESVLVHSRQDLTYFDQVIDVSGNEIKMKVQPEDLIFMS